MVKSIGYYEGDEEHEIVSLLRDADDLSSYVDIAIERHSSWPIRYHLTASRGNLVRPFNFSGLDVLEVGAGMGAISRVIAESARHLTIVEGTSLRYEGACARLRNLSNWDGVVSNIQDFETERKYDVVCMVGVLEYSELYIDQPDPFAWVLRHLKSFLKSDGVLILAIENKNGLKYFSGATEDHTGRRFDGICGYGKGKSVRTFSYTEMVTLLKTAGFSTVFPYFPAPDYKIPAAVLSGELFVKYPRLAGQILANYPSEDCNGQHLNLFSEALAWESLAVSGLLEEMANSFLFVSTDNAESPVLAALKGKERALAHCYAVHRINPVQTVFIEKGDGLFVEKRSLTRVEQNENYLSQSPVYDGELYMLYILRKMCYEGKNSVLAELYSFICFIFTNFESANRDLLLPKAIDALPHNAIKHDSRYDFFDLEFDSPCPLVKSWFIFRVIFILEKNYAIFSRYDSSFNYKVYYEDLCGRCSIASNYTRDINLENQLQLLISGKSGYMIVEERKPHFMDKVKRKIKSKLRSLLK